MFQFPKKVYIRQFPNIVNFGPKYCTNAGKAMPNRNSVKRQLKFDKPRYLFTKTHIPKTKTQVFYENNNRTKHTTLLKYEKMV